MIFTPEQDRALEGVRRWLASGDSLVYHFFGYAGTGKTTLAKHIRDNVDGDVWFLAYTGKAAHVLRSKGCYGATTIHSAIYHSREKSAAHIRDSHERLAELIEELRTEYDASDEFIEQHPKVRELRAQIKEEEKAAEQPFFVLNPNSDIKDAELIIIDECSMVDDRIGSDLLSFGVPVLVLGDPAQLPPIMGGGYFTENVKPDVMLTEIHRQAAESPILRLATDVRQEKPLTPGDYGDLCRVLPFGAKIDPEEVLSYDQILVGRNRTRHSTNRKVRVLLGISDPYPVVGDRLVCRKNNHELGLLNGAIYYVTALTGVMDRKVHMAIRPEDSDGSLDVVAHEHFFLGTEDELGFFEKKGAERIEYGYGVTVHVSQGSQWDSVLLFDESFCFRKDRYRWLYTGITRAANRLTVVKM